jgi:ubiquinone biosynthesis protein UbiJ
MRVAEVARSMLAVELDMCEFLMRYCGEVMARQFMQTAKRPWTILAQLKVQPNIA